MTRSVWNFVDACLKRKTKKISGSLKISGSFPKIRGERTWRRICQFVIKCVIVLFLGKSLTPLIILTISPFVIKGILKGLFPVAHCAGRETALPRELIKGQISGRGLPRTVLERLNRDQISEIDKFKDIHPEDIRSYLVQNWEGVKELSHQCSRNELPATDDTYELLASLYPDSLSSSFDVLKKGLGLHPEPEEVNSLIVPALQLGPEQKNEIRFILQEIGQSAIGCTDNFASFIEDLTKVAATAAAGIQIQVPPLEAPLEDKADLLMEQFAGLERTGTGLPLFFKRHHLSKIYENSLSLSYLYGRLFKSLPYDPEMLFPESRGVSDRVRERLREIIDINHRAAEGQPQSHAARLLLEEALLRTGLPKEELIRRLEELIAASNDSDSDSGTNAESCVFNKRSLRLKFVH